MTNNERLFKLFRESNEPNFMKFLDSLEGELKDDVVIDATSVFIEKKRYDEFLKGAEKIKKSIEDHKDE